MSRLNFSTTSQTQPDDQDIVITQYLARYMMDYKDPEKRQNVLCIVEAKNGIMDRMTIHKGDGKTETFEETWQC